MGFFKSIFGSVEKISAGEALFKKGEHSQAFQLLNESENKSDARSLYLIGLMLHNGMGITQNIPLGVTKLVQAADGGDGEAQDYVSVGFGDGSVGFLKDEGKAIQYAQLAMSQNVPNAFANMGNRYLLGLGVNKDLKMARTLLERGVKLGSSQAESTLTIFDILSK